ncbi:rhomboid family intramembrane serine protease [Halostella salina]|uniref:rhomboid family intramembrane serine protease n=1 Tax=Halostella salina TaxID=1547897 RepID=UPI000EF77FC5|nr:rhomboid family intramembrane serine protease [Halostella salina]
MTTSESWKKQVSRSSSKAVVRLNRCRITLALTVAIGFIYLIEVALAGSIRSGAAYEYLQSLRTTLGPLFGVISPFVHSDHGHILQNSLFLLIFGSLVERRTETGDYLFFVLFVGIAGNTVGSPIHITNSVGISAVTYGLQARETVYRSVHLYPINESQIVDWIIWVSAIVLIGNEILSPTSGGSYSAHLFGIIVGALFESVSVANIIHKV